MILFICADAVVVGARQNRKWFFRKRKPVEIKEKNERKMQESHVHVHYTIRFEQFGKY